MQLNSIHQAVVYLIKCMLLTSVVEVLSFLACACYIKIVLVMFFFLDSPEDGIIARNRLTCSKNEYVFSLYLYSVCKAVTVQW